MEDYIFIIIAIVLSALGAINKKNKKKRAQMANNDQEGNDHPSFFETQFSDPFFNNDSDEDPFFSKSAELIPEPKVEVKPTSEYQTVTQKARAQKDRNLEHEEPEEETRLGGIMKDFSMKKAVIYSEILERKY